MRKVFLFVGLSLFFLNVNAQVNEAKNDLQAIQKTLDLYMDGQAFGDSAKVAQAFHDSWQLKGFSDNEFRVIPKAKYLVGYKKRDAKPNNWSARTVFIDISNNAAVAKVEISTSKLLFTDYFNLLRTDKGWFIVDKISSRVPHKTVETPAVKSK